MIWAEMASRSEFVERITQIRHEENQRVIYPLTLLVGSTVAIFGVSSVLGGKLPDDIADTMVDVMAEGSDTWV